VNPRDIDCLATNTIAGKSKSVRLNVALDSTLWDEIVEDCYRRNSGLLLQVTLAISSSLVGVGLVTAALIALRRKTANYETQTVQHHHGDVLSTLHLNTTPSAAGQSQGAAYEELRIQNRELPRLSANYEKIGLSTTADSRESNNPMYMNVARR
jgi:hypothetical protein